MCRVIIGERKHRTLRCTVDAATRLTNLTFVQERLNWNDARDVCHEIGGHLVEIRDVAKKNVVLHILRENTPDGYIGGKDVSIGLVELPLGESTFYWAENCDPVTVTFWRNGELEKPSQGKFCIKLSERKETWTRALCAYGRRFMCETNSDEKCGYDVFADTSLTMDDPWLNSITRHASRQECIDLCDTLTTENGTECWAFNFIASTQHCVLLFTDSPFRVSYSDFVFMDGWDLYTKHCFNVFVHKSYNLTRDVNMAVTPDVNCTLTPLSPSVTTLTSTVSQMSDSSSGVTSSTMDTVDFTSTTRLFSTSAADHISTSAGRDTQTSSPSRTTDTKDTSVSTTTASSSLTTRPGSNSAAHRISTAAGLDTRTTPPLRADDILTSSAIEMVSIRAGSLSSLSSMTHSVSSSHALPTSPPSVPTSRSPSALPNPDRVSANSGYSFSSRRVATVKAANSADISSSSSTSPATSSSTRQLCYCRCKPSLSLPRNEYFLQEVLTNLTLNKSALSSVRRKYHSVMEYRPLAIGIGTGGAMCLVLTFAFILFSDILFALSQRLNSGTRETYEKGL